MMAKHRISVIYCDKGRLEVDGFALVLKTSEQSLVLPVGASSALFMMPGTVVTHAAIKLCAEEGALLVWVGEGGTRTYSAGNPGGACAENILHQASLILNTKTRLTIAKKLYSKMFNSSLNGRSIEQLRGEEGSRTKKLYQELANKAGIENWGGRITDENSDPVNQAISYANAALYGLTEAVILALGYSPALGFVHRGNPRSFVFDVADCFKYKTTVPMGMSIAAESTDAIGYRVKIACRDMFFEKKMTEQLIDFIESIFDEGILRSLHKPGTA